MSLYTTNGLAPYKIIATGFDNFGKSLKNPSGLAVKALPEHLEIGDRTVSVQGLLLESCCKSSWAAVEKILSAAPSAKSVRMNNQKSCTILLLTGVAEDRTSLGLERFALNVRDYPIRDKHGHKYEGVQIVPGPLALKTDYPLSELQKQLRSQGFPATISNHAGTFVCNDLYYQALTHKEKHGTPDLVLFLHVPKANVFAQSVRDYWAKSAMRKPSGHLGKADQIELLKDAIIEILKFSVFYCDLNRLKGLL